MSRLSILVLLGRTALSTLLRIPVLPLENSDSTNHRPEVPFFKISNFYKLAPSSPSQSPLTASGDSIQSPLAASDVFKHSASALLSSD